MCSSERIFSNVSLRSTLCPDPSRPPVDMAGCIFENTYFHAWLLKVYERVVLLLLLCK